jgi:ABC-2 type transport system ATP-binding protein
LLADVEDVCDRISILYGGKIQAEGQVRDLLLQTNKMQITTDAISDNAVERIKQLIKEEHAECQVTSPMDKLETFFIKTVEDAQQQAQPTSGAVSRMGISDFLAAEAAQESILDKLVSAPVTRKTAPDSPRTEQVVPVETSETRPDGKLLSELSKPDKPVQPKPVARSRKVETQPVETEPKPEQVKKSILDQLTDRSTPQGDDGEQADKSQKQK